MKRTMLAGILIAAVAIGIVDTARAEDKPVIQLAILLDTIHCGSDDEGRKGYWKDGALLADGQYMFIDSNQAVAHIDAPQDKEIARLGVELNETYVLYGNAGVEASARQAVQDSNAISIAQGSSVNRAVFKASANYRNEAWDLVDAVKTNAVKLEDVKEAELPEEMRKLSVAERKTFLYLGTNPGRAVSREELMSRLWGLELRHLDTRTVDMHIMRLRTKLRDDPEAPAVLFTVRGKGYKFM